MIWYYIITFFGNLLSAVLSAFHLPIVTTLPFGMDDALTNAIGYFNYIRTNVPPLNVIFTCTVVYLSFKVTLFFLRQFRIFKD